MKKVNIRKDELFSAIRKKSFGSLDEVRAVVFETDGSFSVIKKSKTEQNITYSDFLEKKG